jgi:hypothetical protein
MNANAVSLADEMADRAAPCGLGRTSMNPVLMPLLGHAGFRKQAALCLTRCDDVDLASTPWMAPA